MTDIIGVVSTITYLDPQTGEILGMQKFSAAHQFQRDLVPRPTEPLIIEFDWGYFDGAITVDVEYEPGHAWTAYAGPRRNGAE